MYPADWSSTLREDRDSDVGDSFTFSTSNVKSLEKVLPVESVVVMVISTELTCSKLREIESFSFSCPSTTSNFSASLPLMV